MVIGSDMITSMAKVGLALYVVAREPDGQAHTGKLHFILGIRPQGLTPFEQALVGQSVGGTIQIEVASPGALETLFGHLGCSISRIIGIEPPFVLNAEIISVGRPSDRELVKAMARMAGCASGCNCGCGG